MTENLHLDILSVAPLGSTERLAGLGRTLDAVPELAPEKMGPRDPPRTRIRSVAHVDVVGRRALPPVAGRPQFRPL